MKQNHEQLLECAVAAAKSAAMHAKNNRDRRYQVAQAFSHDVKLQLDRESQEQAESVIRRRYPEHGILGEETAPDFVPEETVWIIDPIDGTVNFFHGLPYWCSSVAVRHENRVVAGAVYAPDLQVCYTATIERRSECNGRRIEVSGATALSDAMLATGTDMARVPESFELLKNLSINTQKIRIMGSSALDICNVAHGKIEGYYEGGIYIWDVAAAGLIAEQAGGRAEILETHGPHGIRFLATNGHIHDELKRMVTIF